VAAGRSGIAPPAPGAPFYAVYVTPGNGINVQYRSTTGGSAQQATALTSSAPVYLNVSRSGNVFTAYTSTDGATWTQIAGSTVRLTNLSGTLLAGLADTSHNGGALCAVKYQSVAVG
jgi:beta-xylosidase